MFADNKGGASVPPLPRRDRERISFPMLHIVPVEVNTLLAQQSLEALHAIPATCSGMTPIGAILDTTRFSLTQKGREALAAALPTAHGCPQCGAPVEKTCDRIGSFYECDTPGCFFTITAREWEAKQ